MMSSPDYAKVRQQAKVVLRENNVLSPPILPREIASNYGLNVIFAEFEPEDSQVAGFLDFGDRAIYVNNDDHFNRQTFTVAHELGHYLLHKDLFEQHPDAYKVLMRMPIGAETDPVEKEANAFAAELLVPRKFLDLYSKYASLDDLADLFAVSKEVISYRLNFGSSAKTF